MPAPGSQRGCRLNHQQKLLLLQYARDHPQLLTTKLNSNFTPLDRVKLWEDVAKLLNSQGAGAIKSPHEWRKMKNDMGNYMRYKLQGGKMYLKKGVMPHIFHCQRPPIPARQTGQQRRHKELIRDLMASQPSSSHIDAAHSFGTLDTPRTIVSKVNLVPPKEVAMRSVQSWNDWKTKARNKWQKMRSHEGALGDASPFRSRLNAEEEKLMDLVGWVRVDGDKHIEEHEFKKPVDTPGPSQSLPVIVIKKEVLEDTPEMPNSHFEDADSSKVEDNLQDKDFEVATIPNDCGIFPMVVVKEEVPEDTPEMQNSPFEDADSSEMEEENLQDTDFQPETNAQPKTTGKRRRETAVERAATNFAHLQKQQIEATVQLKNSIEGLTQAVNLQIEAIAQVVQVFSSFLPSDIS